MPITIDPEFANLCPALKPEEKAGLEADLIAAGRARVALDVWGDILLDGHNRHEICTRLGLPFEVAQVDGIEAREQARNWIISNQLNRRNLAPTEASYLRGKRYNAEKLTPVEAAEVGRQAQLLAESENRHPPRGTTADRLAPGLGVVASTLKEDGTFAAAVDSIAANVSPEAAREIRGGTVKIPKKQIREIGKMPPAQQAAALKQAKEKPKRPTAAKLGPIKPMERAAISQEQKQLGYNFMHALRLLRQMKSEPEVLAKMPWPENWREQINANLADAINYLADFSAAWNHEENMT